MLPVVADAPGAFRKLRSRLGLRSTEGQNANLSLTIQPTVDLDKLLQETRTHYAPLTPNAASVFTILSCPTGSFCMLKRIAIRDEATTNYTWYLAINAPPLVDPTATPINSRISVDFVAAGAADRGVLDLTGITLRPSTALTMVVTTWVAGGGGTEFLTLMDEEICSS